MFSAHSRFKCLDIVLNLTGALSLRYSGTGWPLASISGAVWVRK